MGNLNAPQPDRSLVDHATAPRLTALRWSEADELAAGRQDVEEGEDNARGRDGIGRGHRQRMASGADLKKGHRWVERVH